MASSSAARGSATRARRAAAVSPAPEPRTAAASTSASVAGARPAQRSPTSTRNERGAGGDVSAAQSRPGNSSRSARACSGLPPVTERRVRAARAVAAAERPSPAARSHRSSSPSPRSRSTTPRWPVTRRRRLSGRSVTASSRVTTRARSWSATSRRRAKISARSDGRSAQWASSRTSTTSPSSAERVQHPQDAGADGDRVVRRRARRVAVGSRGGARRRVRRHERRACGSRGPGELVDHAVAQQRLRLVAADPQHPERGPPRLDVRGRRGEEPLDQGRLADAGRSFDQDDGRLAAQRGGQPVVQQGELGPAPDERGVERGPAASADHAARPPPPRPPRSGHGAPPAGPTLPPVRGFDAPVSAGAPACGDGRLVHSAERPRRRQASRRPCVVASPDGTRMEGARAG